MASSASESGDWRLVGFLLDCGCAIPAAHHAIAAAPFCQEQGLVRGFEQGVRTARLIVSDRNADAHRDRFSELANGGGGPRCDGRAQAFPTPHRGVQVRAADDDEFFAAVAANHVAAANFRLQQRGHGLQHGVPHVMPEGIVDRLEFVDVHHHAGQRGTAAPCRRPVVLQPVDQVAAVGQSREDVGQGIQFETPVGDGELGLNPLELLAIAADLLLQGNNAQTGPDAGEQGSGRERFGHEVVHAGLKQSHESLFIVGRRQHDDVGLPAGGCLPESAAEFQPADLRQIRVDDDQLRGRFEKDLQGVVSVRRTADAMP